MKFSEDKHPRDKKGQWAFSREQAKKELPADHPINRAFHIADKYNAKKARKKERRRQKTIHPPRFTNGPVGRS